FEKAAGLKVNLNKSRVYGIGMNRDAVEDMARRMQCSVGELTITYLGLPIGVCMRRESAWRPVIEKFTADGVESKGNVIWSWREQENGLEKIGFYDIILWDEGLNIESLKAKNWSLIGKWWWWARMDREAPWVRVVKSIYGFEGVV
ncbi:hypothetical protein Tco_1059300, partial [Tanacetum coccineum]